MSTNLLPNKVTATPIEFPGVKILNTTPKLINLSTIFVNPQSNNLVRVNVKDEQHVQKLSDSLRNGIDYNSRVPIVIENPRVIDGINYRYELLDGHHRFEALVTLKKTEWLFWVYEVGTDGVPYNDALRMLQLRSNDHQAALSSSVDDTVGIICELIKKGSSVVQNNENSIKNFVRLNCKNTNSSTQGKIVRSVMAKLETYRRVVTYTSKDTVSWIDKNTSLTHSGQFDSARKKFGWNVLEGYEYEFVMNAVKKFGETNRESYFTCRTKAPTEDRDLITKRDQMLREFHKLENCLLDVMKFYTENKRFPWEVVGFIPQDQETEKSDELIYV